MPLESGSAIKVGTTRFYFLLPLALPRPKLTYAELTVEVL